LKSYQEKFKVAEQAKLKLDNEIEKLTYIIKESYEEIEKLKKDY
jgi:hypothetical protein